MATEITRILKQFCHKGDHRTVDLARPFSEGDYTYASDGWIALRVPRVDGVPENGNAPLPSRLPWDHDEIGDWIDLPDYDLDDADDCRRCKGSGREKSCYECHGAGEVELHSGYHVYSCECLTCGGGGILAAVSKDDDPCGDCNGTGKRLMTPVEWGRAHISMALLERIKVLPGVQLSKHGADLQPFRFKWDGGVGLVMPMRA